MGTAGRIEITLGKGAPYMGEKREGFLDTVVSVEMSTFARGTGFYRS